MNLENITFGIELETIVPVASAIATGSHGMGRTVESALTPIALQVSAPKFNGQSWKADRDPSIRANGNYRACEFVSPVLQGEAGVLHVLDFISFLEAIGAKVNESCGMHVHVGLSAVGDTEEARLHFVKILTRLVNRKATALYAQTGTASRETGRWCAMASDSYRSAVNGAGRGKNLSRAAQVSTRYHLLNLASIARHGTVEFRCFAGTTNPNKVLLHLLSVFTFCRQAAERKGLLSWADPREQFTGEQMVRNVLRPSNFKALFPVFCTHRKAIVEIGLKMARKYDVEKALRNAPLNPVPTTLRRSTAELSQMASELRTATAPVVTA